MMHDTLESITEKLNYGELTISRSKELAENICISRFNNFIIVFSLFVTGGFANSFINLRAIVFYFGAFLLFLCLWPLWRAIKRFEFLLTLLFNKEGSNYYYLKNFLINYDKSKSKAFVSKWTSIIIPFSCILFLLVMGFLISFGIMK